MSLIVGLATVRLLKACTHTPILGGLALESVLESADYNIESDSFSTDSVATADCPY